MQVYFDLMPNSIEHIRGGKVRALAITAATRSEVLPDLPSVGDFVRGYEVNTWFGVGAPKGTPTEIVNKLNQEIMRASPIPRSRRGSLSSAARCLRARLGKLIAEEAKKWAKVIRTANIKPD